jgi:hypothetical protein
MLRADKITDVAGDAALEHEGRTRISANKRLYFLLRLIFRKLEHGAALKADSTAIAQIFPEETEPGIVFHSITTPRIVFGHQFYNMVLIREVLACSHHTLPTLLGEEPIIATLPARA